MMEYFTIDTNVFIHYKFFTEIDWCKEFNCSELTLVLPHSIYKELGEKKYSRDISRKLKDRIRRTEKRLTDIDEGDKIVRKGVKLQILDNIKDDEVKKYGFDLSNQDGWHLASIKEYEKNTGSKVMVVSADYPFLHTARKMNCITYKMPDKYEEIEKDMKELKVEELQNKLNQYEKKQPAFNIEQYEPNESNVILSIKEYDNNSLALQLFKAICGYEFQKVSPIYQGFSVVLGRYSDEEYLKKLLKYCQEIKEFMIYNNKFIIIRFIITNNGTLSASNILIKLKIEAEGKCSTCLDDYARQFKLITPPERVINYIPFGPTSYLVKKITEYKKDNTLSVWELPKFGDGEYNYIARCDKLLKSESVITDRIYLLMEDDIFNDRKVKINVSIICDEVIKPVIAEFVFNITSFYSGLFSIKDIRSHGLKV